MALIKQRRRPKNRLGFAIQLAYVRFPGRTWLASEEVPPRVLVYIADQLRVNPMSLVQYAQDREATRFEHQAELQRVYGFRSFSAQTYRLGRRNNLFLGWAALQGQRKRISDMCLLWDGSIST